MPPKKGKKRGYRGSSVVESTCYSYRCSKFGSQYLHLVTHNDFHFWLLLVNCTHLVHIYTLRPHIPTHTHTHHTHKHTEKESVCVREKHTHSFIILKKSEKSISILRFF